MAEKSKEKSVIKLDEQQRAIVEANEKNIIVVAAAGSGKTFVLVKRVERLLNEGLAPHNLVCITFTNTAAQEMKERLKDVPGIGDAFIGTIHSFANHIYKESGNTYRIRTSEVELELYKEILPSTTYAGCAPEVQALSFERLMAYLDMQDLLEKRKATEAEVESFLLPSEREALGRADYIMANICRDRNIISFDDLLRYANEYFEELGANLDHLMVDEFQDVGRNEYRFIKGLKANNNFYIGDDYQSLFGFKGGDVDIYMGLANGQDFKTYLIERNYRSSKAVMSLAEQVISQVTNKISKKVVVTSKNEGKVTIGTKGNLDIHLNRIKQEENYKDWFILAWSNADIAYLEEKLEQAGVPTITFKRQGLSNSEMESLVASNAVKLLTVHVSKGLESPNVLLYGNFKQFVPKYLLNETERKVMYVGVTRAQDELIVLN